MVDVADDFTRETGQALMRFMFWFARQVGQIDLPKNLRHHQKRVADRTQEYYAPVEDEYARDLSNEAIAPYLDLIEKNFTPNDPSNLVMQFETVWWDNKGAILSDRFDEAGIPYQTFRYSDDLVGFEFNRANLVPVLAVTEALCESGIRGLDESRIPNLDELCEIAVIEKYGAQALDDPELTQSTQAIALGEKAIEGSTYAFPHDRAELDQVCAFLDERQIPFEIVHASDFDSMGNYCIALDSNALQNDTFASELVEDLSDRKQITAEILENEAMQRTLAEYVDIPLDRQPIDSLTPEKVMTLEINTFAWDKDSHFFSQNFEKAHVPFELSVDRTNNIATYTFSRENAPFVKDMVDQVSEKHIRHFSKERFPHYEEFSRVADKVNREQITAAASKLTGVISGSVESQAQAEVLRNAFIAHRLPFEMRGRDFYVREADAFRHADKIPSMKTYAERLSRGENPYERTPSASARTAVRPYKPIIKDKERGYDYSRKQERSFTEIKDHARRAARDKSIDVQFPKRERGIER